MKQELVCLLALLSQLISEIHDGISVAFSYPSNASYSVFLNKQIGNLLGFFAFDSAAVEDGSDCSHKLPSAVCTFVISVAICLETAFDYVFRTFSSKMVAGLVWACYI